MSYLQYSDSRQQNVCQYPIYIAIPEIEYFVLNLCIKENQIPIFWNGIQLKEQYLNKIITNKNKQKIHKKALQTTNIKMPNSK